MWSRPSIIKQMSAYRGLKKIKITLGLFGKMSSRSVLTTYDYQYAKTVYDLAKQYGKASLYAGVKLE
jgi:hypothetical protein